MISTQLTQNNLIFERMNLKAWYDAGYYGSGSSVATTERWDLNRYPHNGLCIDPILEEVPGHRIGTMVGFTQHGEDTARAFHQIAPKAKIIMLPCTGYNPSQGINDFEYYGKPYILKNGVSGMTDSRYTSATRQEDKLDPVLEDVNQGFTWFAAAGNKYGGGDYNMVMRSEKVIGCGALELSWSSLDKTYSKSYSSEYEGVDFSASGKIVLQNPDGGTYTVEGTSFATPILAGVSALVNEFFKKKTGKVLSFDQMYQFLKDCTYDVGNDGRDTKAGWGMPVLPNPEDIDVSKYVTIEAPYSDWDKVADWAKEAVLNMKNIGLMTGDNESNFNPQAPITRQEAAVVFDRLVTMNETLYGMK